MPAAPSRGGRGPLGLAAVVVIAVVLAAGGCRPATRAGPGRRRAPRPRPTRSPCRRDGTTLKNYDLAALRALPQSRVVIDGKAQTGPSLAALLEDAGARQYDAVEVRGAGLRDKGLADADGRTRSGRRCSSTSAIAAPSRSAAPTSTTPSGCVMSSRSMPAEAAGRRAARSPPTSGRSRCATCC